MPAGEGLEHGVLAIGGGYSVHDFAARTMRFGIHSNEADVLRQKGVAVSATDKAKDKVQAAKGKIKKGTGRALDDRTWKAKAKPTR